MSAYTVYTDLAECGVHTEMLRTAMLIPYRIHVESSTHETSQSVSDGPYSCHMLHAMPYTVHKPRCPCSVTAQGTVAASYSCLLAFPTCRRTRPTQKDRPFEWTLPPLRNRGARMCDGRYTEVKQYAWLDRARNMLQHSNQVQHSSTPINISNQDTCTLQSYR